MTLWIAALAVAFADAPVGAHDVAPDAITADLSDPLPIDGRVRSGHLANGLSWYVEPNARPADRAELRLVVKAGSVLESDDQRGVAHFLEHMAFNGTEHFEGTDLISFFEAAGMRFGSHLNAYTTFDETVYVLQVPTDDAEAFDTGFLVMRDWLDGITFDPQECDAERGVVLEEWRLSQGLQQRMQDASLPLVMGGSRYLDRLPIGTEESLKAIDCDAAKAFWDTWYKPDLATVVAVGDFDADEVIGKIEHWFGDLPAAEEAGRPWFEVPLHPETRVGVFADAEFTQTAVQLQDKVVMVEGDTHEAYVDFLVSQVAYLAANERLVIASQDPDAPVLGIFATMAPMGHLREGHAVQAIAKSGQALDALRFVATEVARIDRHGFTPAEVQRAKDQLRRSMQTYYDERDLTDHSTHVDELLRVILTDEAMPGIPYEYAMSNRYLPEITVDDVNAWTRERWMPATGRVVQVLQPAEAEEVTEDGVRAVLAEVGRTKVEPPEADAEQAPLMAELPAPGKAKQIATDDDVGTTTWRLSNGATVVLKPTTFQADEVLLEGFLPGGTATVSDADFIPAVTATALRRRSGVGVHDAIGLAKTLAGTDVSVQVGIGATRNVISGSSSARDLETLLQYLHLVLTQPRFDERAFQLEQASRREALAFQDANPDTVFEEAWAKLVWGDDPRKQPFTTDDLDQMDLARSEALYREAFSSFRDATFVLVGNLDAEVVVPLLERYLASLPKGKKRKAIHTSSVPEDGTRSIEVDRGDTPRALVRVRFQGPFHPSPTRQLQLDTVAGVLQTRLLEELREVRGGTYGVGVDAGFSLEPEGRYRLSIQFECDPARLDELVSAMWDTIERTRTEPFAASGMQSMRRKQERGWETDKATNGWWLSVLVNAALQDLDPAIVADVPGRLDAMAPVVIRDLAAVWLDPERRLVGLAVPPK